jgi:L-threonylcarbamoyladenylate synthase
MPVETRRISIGRSDWLDEAVRVLHAGGLVAFPTDTVYGVGGLATDGGAIEAIYRAKGRAAEKAIPVLVSDWAHLEGVALSTPRAERLAAAFWPGPLTIVLRRDVRLPASLGPGDTVGVRAPDHPAALRLLLAAGPLATSSANRSGAPDPQTADQVWAVLEGRIDLVVDGGKCPGGRPSTVVDCTGESPVVLRQGPVALEAILAIWTQKREAGRS